MTASGSYTLPSSSIAADAEIKRLAAQAQSGWGKEARNLSWFGLRDGMSVLEVGSGPGFITEQLLAMLPTSQITCVEVEHALIEQAKQHLHDKAKQRVRFIEGSVMEMALDSNQFDFAYARLIFQHLPDPVGAAQEIRRVLKLGGKLVIYDVDDGIFGLFQPPIPEFAKILETFGQSQTARGGNRQIGRQLWQILKAVGFTNFDVEVLASDSAEIGVEPFLRHIDPERMRSLVTQGLLTEEELERYRVALKTFRALPEAYTLWLSLMMCAEKPV